MADSPPADSSPTDDTNVANGHLSGGPGAVRRVGVSREKSVKNLVQIFQNKQQETDKPQDAKQPASTATGGRYEIIIIKLELSAPLVRELYYWFCRKLVVFVVIYISII